MGKGRTTTGMILACLVKDLVHGDPNKKHPKLEKVDRAKFPNEDEYIEEVRSLIISWHLSTGSFKERSYVPYMNLQ